MWRTEIPHWQRFINYDNEKKPQHWNDTLMYYSLYRSLIALKACDKISRYMYLRKPNHSIVWRILEPRGLFRVNMSAMFARPGSPGMVANGSQTWTSITAEKFQSLVLYHLLFLFPLCDIYQNSQFLWIYKIVQSIVQMLCSISQSQLIIFFLQIVMQKCKQNICSPPINMNTSQLLFYIFVNFLNEKLTERNRTVK